VPARGGGTPRINGSVDRFGFSVAFVAVGRLVVDLSRENLFPE